MSIYEHYTIYKIINLINNKIYIGQTTRSPEIRWKQHFYDSKDSPSPIYRAMRKYGLNNFVFAPICSCFDLDELNLRETYFIDLFHSNNSKFGYNCNRGGSNTITSEQAKINMSLAQIGRKLPPDHPARRTGKDNPNFGKKRPEHSKMLLEKHYDPTIYQWINKDGRMESCTATDLCIKYNDIKLKEIKSLANTKNRKYEYKGWSRMLSKSEELYKQFHQSKIITNISVKRMKVLRKGAKIKSDRKQHWEDRKSGKIIFKRPDQSGKNNNNYNHTVYHWLHTSGLEEYAVRSDFIEKYNLVRLPSIHFLIKENKFSYKGWSIVTDNPTIIQLFCQNKKIITTPRNPKIVFLTENLIKLEDKRSGSNNIKYDHTIYHWKHISDIEEYCTRYDLCKIHGLRKSDALRGLIKQTSISYNGWSVIFDQQELLNH